ncbi:MAG: hypothetical protein RLZZ352_2 [Pseudomonadota bacterium]|jgi:hypothetical protein
MKVADLHTGEQVELPSRVAPGRYRVLERLTLNGAVELQPGDVLWSDDGTRCDLQAATGPCLHLAFEPISTDEAASWELIDQGVMTLADLVRQMPDGLPAPLMPNSLKRFAHPSRFEDVLERVLGAGHLHEISARPRMNMRYDTAVLPVSRARRLASGALERLVSRSEDWYGRTLDGVEPARVLAEVSEDEWGIYENIVFARLIDRSIQLLAQHERALVRLIERQDSALKLSKAEDLNYRLRENLCQLWGQVELDIEQQKDDDSLDNDPLRIRLNKLHNMSRRLRQLQFGSLYQAVTRSAQVPVALKNTNILMHDPHYREMREVWQLAYEGTIDAHQIPPKEKIKRRMMQHQNYNVFVGLLIRHALAACKALKLSKNDPKSWKFAGADLTLTQPNIYEWELQLKWPHQLGSEVKRLTFVAAWAGQASWPHRADNVDRHDRQVVYCHPTSADTEVSETGEDAVLNPLQFYAVERIKHRIENWLYQSALEKYPMIIESMPTDLCDQLCKAYPRSFVKKGKGLMVVAMVQGIDISELTQEMNQGTASRLQEGLDVISTLSKCRVCAVDVKIKTTPEQKTFWANCECGYEWGTKLKTGTLSRNIVFRFKGEEGDFRRYGAWY